MRRRYRLKLWWLGLDNLDRASITASVFLLGFLFWLLAFLLGVL